MYHIASAKSFSFLPISLVLTCMGCSGSPSSSTISTAPQVAAVSRQSDAPSLNIADLIVAVDGLPSDARSTINCAPGGRILVSGSIGANTGQRYYDDDFVVHQKGGVAALDPDHLLPRIPHEILDESRGTYLVLATKLTDVDRKHGEQMTDLARHSNFIFRKLREDGRQADFALKGQALPEEPGVYLLTLEIFTPTSIKQLDDGKIDFGQSRIVEVCNINVSNDAAVPIQAKE